MHKAIGRLRRGEAEPEPEGPKVLPKVWIVGVHQNNVADLKDKYKGQIEFMDILNDFQQVNSVPQMADFLVVVLGRVKHKTTDKIKSLKGLTQKLIPVPDYRTLNRWLDTMIKMN